MSNVWERRLMWLGIIVPILLNVIATVDALTRPGFNILRHWISHQSLGGQGWIGTWTLLLSGLLICVFAIVMSSNIRSMKGSIWAAILIGTYGAGLLLASLFPIDPGLDWPPGVPAGRSVSGSVHDMAGAIVFGSLTAVCFVMSRFFKSMPDWKRWRHYSIASGAGVFIAFLMCSVLVAMDYSNSLPGAPSGLFERISMAIGNLGIILFTLRLMNAGTASK